MGAPDPLGRRRRAALTCLLLALAWTPACSAPVDLKASLQVGDVTTGWFDQGIVEGKNKLVPSIAFTLTNTSDRTLSSVQLNVVFRRVGEADEWDAVYMRGVDSNGLDPGASTSRLVVRAKLGYTGEQPRAEMLQHAQFVDAKVQVFAKYGSSQWTSLGEFPITRQLLTQ